MTKKKIPWHFKFLKQIPPIPMLKKEFKNILFVFQKCQYYMVRNLSVVKRYLEREALETEKRGSAIAVFKIIN